MTGMTTRKVQLVSRSRANELNTVCNLHANMVERQRWIEAQISFLMMCVHHEGMRSVQPIIVGLRINRSLLKRIYLEAFVE